MPVHFTPRKPAPSSPLPIAEKLAVSKAEAAAMLSVSQRHLDNLVKQNKIIARKIGTRVLFPVKALEDFLNQPVNKETNK